MDTARWHQVEHLYHAVLEKPPADRAMFLERSCAGDASLREEVESLLSFADHADGYLQEAVREVASEASGVSAAAALLHDLPPEGSQKLGRYELLEEIGRGGMAVVYRARDPAIGRIVAIKTILIDRSNAESSELAARLQRESQAGGRLSHPNIVAVYDVNEQGKTAYIVMEYVQGRTLDRVIREDHPSLRSSGEAVRIVQECAAALDYAHSQGVVHRDIKPANIMLQADGAVKIADFGIAKVSQSTPLTQSAVAIGSPHYMAPEQWRGEPVTGQTDQYALAAVAYTLLTGRRLFEGDTVASFAAMTLYQEPPSAVTYNARLNSAVDEVLRKALSKTGEARYASCSEFAGALRRACENVPAASPAPASVAGKRRTTWIASAAAAALLVALSAAGWRYDQSKNSHVASAVAKVQLDVPKSKPRSDVKPVPEVPQPQPPPAKTKVKETSERRVAPPPDPLPIGDPQKQGDDLLKQGDYAAAVQSFTKAIALKPDYRSYFGRANAYQRLEQQEKAIDDYSQAIHFKPDGAMAYHDRAVCEARLLRNDLAFSDYSSALKLDPDNPRTWNGRGAIYLRRKEYQEAISDFTEAIRLQPTLVQAYENRAKAKKALGDTAGANADLNQASLQKQQQPVP